MLLDHWRLNRWPFHCTLDVNRFYPSPGLDEALARIEYLVETRKRLGLLLGEAGIGKTLALRVAARSLARQGRNVVLADVAGVGTRDFLWQMAAGLGTAPREDADVARLWRQVADRVQENRWQQQSTVLLVDDSSQAGPDILTQFLRLARLDPTPDARWTIVLAAEPGHAAHWGDALRELVDLRINMKTWTEEDTAGYVQTALVDAGRFDPVFDDEALAALYQLSGGVPRRVVRFADAALMSGAAAEMEIIDAATVRAACGEMGWRQSSPALHPATR